MESISIKSKARTELIDITGQIQQTIASSGAGDGLAFIYVPHTTAGLTINEGADPAVQRDLISVLNEIVPWEYDYHHLEGNSPAHIKSSLVGSGVQVIFENRQLCLGTWQKIFFCEFDGPRNRKAWIKLL
ncbi:MAG: YjbQ family protein [Deltaproteobacteria bacterium]|nr:YjbQ family protein [Deltaproteobacteria bacterium]MBW1719082.1 YjbQ family protein [Deltaproteobacteria bacterium]MBW1932641.1 YjbQ family protein [Deltaproteobacteria bacterium]MBW1937967.1 YjbQ family protein [Deltaproteobacteria bacterium]MBW1964635.1 YjbQ family protein [Deltaproteobacteria bacterium]